MLRRAVAGTRLRSAFEEEKAVGADPQFVAVSQPSPVDLLAVEDDPVEAAIVEHPDRLAGFVDEDGVAA
jgi:hypothetical protein